jgi:hypothetical protein
VKKLNEDFHASLFKTYGEPVLEEFKNYMEDTLSRCGENLQNHKAKMTNFLSAEEYLTSAIKVCLKSMLEIAKAQFMAALTVNLNVKGMEPIEAGKSAQSTIYGYLQGQLQTDTFFFLNAQEKLTFHAGMIESGIEDGLLDD